MFRKLRASIITVIVLLVTSFAGYSQLSGTYTVDPSSSATSSNYLTISDVCTDLSYGYRSDGGPANGSGSSGAVDIKIYDGTYNENPNLQYVSGSSGGGTITFESNSGDSSKVIITYNMGYSYYQGVFTMFGCDNITLSKLTITPASGTYEANCVSLNYGSNNCTVQNCYLLLPHSSSSFYWGSGVGNDFWNYYMTTDYNTIKNNRISGGFYSTDLEAYLYFGGSNTNTTITGNVMDSAMNYFIYSLSNDNFNYSNNIMENPVGSYCYGILSEYDCNGGPGLISNNKMDLHAGAYGGIYIYDAMASSGSELDIVNNFITNAGANNSQGSGIYTDYCNYVRILYNSINIVGSNTTAALYSDYGTGSGTCTVENNNIVNAGGGYAYFIAYSWANDIGTSDYNNLYTSGSNVGYSYSYGTMAALSDWQTNWGFDNNSVSVDPGYYNTADLHATAPGINGKATPFSPYTTDIDGQTRNASTPDIGADEFTPVNDDAAVTVITNPTGNYCPGSQNINATLKNAGVNTLTSALLTYQVNATTIGTYTWTGSLTTGSTTSVTVGTYSFSSGTYSVDVTSSMPNGVTDLNTANDHAGVSGLHQGMSGTYTIALTGSPNYSTFGAAIADLEVGGLCGAVVFSVGDGTYNENPQLNVPISNASATNTITFQSASNDSTKVIINAQFTYNYYSGLFDLTNTSWVTLNQLTIAGSNTSGQYGHGVWLSGANHCTVSNCVIRGNGVSPSVQHNYSYGIDIDAYNGSGYVNSNDNTVINNSISQYYGGVYDYGMNYSTYNENYDNSYIGNTLDSLYYYGMYAYYEHNLKVNANKIDHIYYSYGYAYPCSIWFSDSLQVVGNKINCSVVCYYGALTLYYNQSSSSYHGLVANNFVRSSGSSSYQGDGIYMYGNTYTDVVYNSVNVTGSSSSYALYDGDGSYNNNSLYNQDYFSLYYQLLF